mmetsp:Transcript_8991/g.15000  ORF Transcript_8991/g.15000 Transcript_8991/m.15000 type:complete len:447 (+) Transcript_8991:147-1487(+)|eukprot:CAMPEP_0119015950 /NCGR_PEP_ID=MMETSP1176-20130426/11737_1 /TAXON_ID=265551 /ORGANISM="Synedropsis recta cf, Strain CCMP1620" /LENGTH=446 /DNA_ID=CAMNT_0006969275 /DNA_START=147 /DNA_END=1487 /DNA_ORIENTATION=+
MGVIQKKTSTRKITPARVIAVVALAFGLLFILENNRTDTNDYDTNVINALRQDGYDVTVENTEKKTEKPKQIHLQEEPESTELSEDKPFDRGESHGQVWPSPIDMFGENAVLRMTPMFGQHRPEGDSVFSFAKGIAFNELVRFMGSLLKTGYDGDIVLATDQRHELTPEMLQYLEYHSNHSHLIVYPAELVCKKIKVKVRCKVFKMFVHKQIGGYLPDPRPHRELAQLRFEYYWAWSTFYSPRSRLFLLDSSDLMFQANPFPLLAPDLANKIMIFEESSIKNIGDEPNNRLWLREGHERKYLHKLGRRPAVCAGTIAGGQPAIETFGRAMVNQWDTSQCTIYGCDQGHVNFLVHGNFLVGSPNIEEVIVERFGESFVMSLSLQILYGKSLRKSKIVQGGSDNVMNHKGVPAAIVHQFDKDEELKNVYNTKKTAPFLKEWNDIKAQL